MAFETYSAEKERLEKEEAKKAAEAAGVPYVEEREEEPELTVSEILADKDDSHHFGLMLEQEPEPETKELIARMQSGKLEADDLIKLEAHRGEFVEKMRSVENIKTNLTPESIAELAKLDPKLEAIINVVGAEKAQAAIENQLAEVAFKDPKRFAKIEKNLDKVNNFKNDDMVKLEGAINEYCKKENIDPKEYQKILSIEKPEDQAKAYSELIRKNWGDHGVGSVRRGVDSIFSAFGLGRFSGPDKAKAKDMADHSAGIQTAFAELQSRKVGLASIMASSLNGNENFRNAMAQEMMGKSSKNEKSGFKEANENLPDEKNIETKWTEYKKKENLNAATWSALSDSEKEIKRKAFSKQMEAEAGKGKDGFWITVVKLVLAAMIEAKKSSLN